MVAPFPCERRSHAICSYARWWRMTKAPWSAVHVQTARMKQAHGKNSKGKHTRGRANEDMRKSERNISLFLNDYILKGFTCVTETKQEQQSSETK